MYTTFLDNITIIKSSDLIPKKSGIN